MMNKRGPEAAAYISLHQLSLVFDRLLAGLTHQPSRHGVEEALYVWHPHLKDKIIKREGINSEKGSESEKGERGNMGDWNRRINHLTGNGSLAPQQESLHMLFSPISLMHSHFPAIRFQPSTWNIHELQIEALRPEKFDCIRG